MFTPEGETVFLSEQADPNAAVLNSGEGTDVHIVAAKQQGGQYVPVPAGGGLETTNLMDPSKPALVMGAAPQATVPSAQAVPFKKAPQASHHLQYAAPKRKRSSRSDRKMSEQQKSDRRCVSDRRTSQGRRSGSYYSLANVHCMVPSFSPPVLSFSTGSATANTPSAVVSARSSCWNRSNKVFPSSRKKTKNSRTPSRVDWETSKGTNSLLSMSRQTLAATTTDCWLEVEWRTRSWMILTLASSRLCRRHNKTLSLPTHLYQTIQLSTLVKVSST